MKDYLGMDLEVGDPVIFIDRRCREYRKGTISRFTRVYVIVDYMQYNVNNQIKQSPAQLIKILTPADIATQLMETKDDA